GGGAGHVRGVGVVCCCGDFCAGFGGAGHVVEEARTPRKSAVGRLVGAEPQAAPVLEEKTLNAPVQATPVAAAPPPPESATSVTEPQPVAAAQPVSATPEKADDQAAAPKKSQKLRPAPAVIKGVLAAQAAAWNEGDLEAFMAGYWKDPDLRFVSGTEVTQGWSRTMKRYRARYGDGADFGQLSFDDLDVEMVTDDVAVVVGRFNLQRDSAVDGGVFTLVMRRFDGRWRIVHDHTVGDVRETKAAATE
ncbi:MAG: nuclear transport factor 2 family protein, partial [Pseudomonadota bacterium]